MNAKFVLGLPRDDQVGFEQAKKKPWILEHAHTPLGPPPPSTVSALGYFFLRRFLDYWGCLVRC